MSKPSVDRALTLVALLQQRAHQHPDQLGYRFLIDGETHESRLTYRELDQRAREIAAALQARSARGQRALLLYPPGLDYIAAFFGCLYAGVVAVPAYPPQANRPATRIQGIAADAGATIALTTMQIIATMQPRLAQTPALAAIEWIATDEPSAAAEDWRDPCVTPEQVAFLQYTSGSTSQPKGVMVSHANLLHNLGLIYEYFGHSEESQGVIWLPPYHDMGLIGGILQPLFGTFPVTLMSPLSFLQRPARWLQAISRYGATTSGGPNFAYELCAQRITPEQRATLDLSRWSVAFNGAEPIHSATMERFARLFADSGFRSEAFFPCYGLAEATLIVAAGAVATPPVVRPFAAAALSQGQVLSAEVEAPGARQLVSSGQSLREQIIVIVPPESQHRGEVGEIWVSGPSVAQGYWDNQVLTEQTFGAQLPEYPERRFVRTGDLGFLAGGELFVTGRLKELIIIGGRNYYPHDIERTAAQSHPALRPGGGAAFAVTLEQHEQLVIVHEVERKHRGVEIEAVAATIRRAVAHEHELQVYAVALIKPGSLPKTSSGKIQRHVCRERFLEGALELIGSSQLDHGAADRTALSRDELAGLEPAAQVIALTEYLGRQLAHVLGGSAASLDAHVPIISLGLTSLAAVELQHRIERDLNVSLPMVGILEGEGLAQLAEQVQRLLDSPDAALLPVSGGAATPETFALSPGQQALWFIHQLAPASSAYNIASAVRLRDTINVAAVRSAFETLVRRHPSLRTTFGVVAGQPQQRVHAQMEPLFQVEQARGWDEPELERALAAAAAEPFDLLHGPLLRVHLFVCDEREHVLLLTIHHIVADFWSLSVLLREFAMLYQAQTSAAALDLPPSISYADYVSWQQQMLQSAEGQQLWAYWQAQLGGELPVLSLPTDRGRPAVQTYQGAAVPVVVSRELTDQLSALSRSEGATLYMTLLAAFAVLLQRYSGQDDLLIGSPTSGRVRAELAQIVGYLINPVVLRANLQGNPSFSTLLARVRQMVLSAFAHQQFPFALLAERLQPNRDPSRSPLFQVMFIMQQSPSADLPALGTLAVGAPGAATDLGALTIEALALPQQTAQFDLTLVMTETEQGLRGSLQYNTDIFDAATIMRMAEHLHTLLAGVAAQPEQPIGQLPLLTIAERREMLIDWNQTATPYPQNVCIHQLFEAQAERTPEATALIFEASALSYGDLNRRANQLAHTLRQRGVGPGVLVGICVGRSPDLLVGLLGILKAGGAYVPLDPSYPQERLAFMLQDAQIRVLLSQDHLVAQLPAVAQIIRLDADWPTISQAPDTSVDSGVAADDLAYVIYTSGSTGKPKGVLLRHQGVVNFFAGMDQRVGCGPDDTLLAVTSISFDISVLELFWTLARGARIVLLSEQASAGITTSGVAQRPIDFSLFYFASDQADEVADRYRLVLEGARFADQHGFQAVWTPERHFHSFGGLYPNPSVMSAALATMTTQVQLRAGSVVLPLHHPLRVAEEWSLVDNLSGGRVGLAFASGWHADDFAFVPGNYADRKAVMLRGIEQVQQLWRGEAVAVEGGAGNQIAVHIYPKPIQDQLPIWLTAAGSAETFVKAGELGLNVLTHLLGQTIDEVAEKIRLYREARARHDHDPAAGSVTLMLHTFIGQDLAEVRARVREPFTAYLRSSVGLIQNLLKSLQLPLDLDQMREQDMDALLAFAFDRYFETSALFGTPETCRTLIDRLKTIDVNEVACLIDFGVETDAVLASLEQLAALKAQTARPAQADYSLAAQARRYRPTLLQCTPSLMHLLSLDQTNLDALQSLRAMLLGGEALPSALVETLKAKLPARLINMYGPTETTIWSATYEVKQPAAVIPIGRPIANTQLYILSGQRQPVPVGVIGELYIGGDGLALGYLNRPELTAERFIASPFAADDPATPGGRLYRTGDLARYRPDGTVEFLGRVDGQVKLRGFRIELGEIEAVLTQHPAVQQAVVVAQGGAGDQRLLAYVVAHDPAPTPADLRAWLQQTMPDYMVPAGFAVLAALPLTANGKVNRRALPAIDELPSAGPTYVAPKGGIEQQITEIWQRVLKRERVGTQDNFFDLGGHSLLMAQVHSELQTSLNRELPLVKLLEYPTIQALAGYLSQQQDQPSFQTSQQRAALQRDAMRRRAQRPQPGYIEDVV